MISSARAGSIWCAAIQPSLHDFPGPIRLQTADEVIVLGVDRCAGEEIGPDPGSEEDGRRGCEYQSCKRRRNGRPPMPSGDEGDRQQQAELRLECHKTEPDAG